MIDLVNSIMALACISAAPVFGSPLAALDLDKPVIDTPLEPHDGRFSLTMLRQLQSTQNTIIPTNYTIKICYDCQNKFQALGLNYTNDMQLFNVTYADCGAEQPWIMCRHTDASIT
jgi:hypothetical protein